MKWLIAALVVAVMIAPRVHDKWMSYWRDVASQMHGKKAWVVQ